MKLERQTLKDTAEAVGFAAIIVSLVLVAVETREATEQTRLNTQALEIGAYQDLIESIIENNRTTWESDSAAEVTTLMRDAVPGEVVDRRLTAALYVQFRHGDMAYYMYEKGAISEERLRSVLRPLPLYGPTGRGFWDRAKTNFVSGYTNYVDALITEGFYEMPVSVES